MYLSDESTVATVMIDGYKIQFFVQGSTSLDSEEVEDYAVKVNKNRLVIKSRTKAGIEKVQEKIESILETESLKENPPTLNIFSKWSNWYRSRLPIRPIEAVALEKDVKESVVIDLQKFLESEQRYTERGLDWHRGYLFHGPPGTGKTSLVKSLAGMFRLNVYFLSLNDIQNDTELITLMSDVEPRSIVLLEDIDSMFDANREVSGEGPTLAGLLNVLDGLCTPYGMICVMTTNHPEKLDPALVRPGRIDVQVELGYCTESQVNEHYSYFYDLPMDNYISVPDDHKIVMSQVAEVTKSYMDEPDIAKQKVQELFT